MVKKNAIAIALAVTAGAIVAAYALWGSMNMGVEGSGNGEPTPVPADTVKIVGNAGSNSFNPNPVQVNVGDTLTWVNDDSGSHTVTARDGAFGSSVLGKGQSFSHTFDEAGEYQYFCEPHPNMTGTVVVAED